MGAKNRISVQDIEPLCKSNCKMKNIEKVEFLINEIVDGGASKVHIVSDFDYTITKQKLDNGKQMLTSFGILHACKSLPQSYLDKSAELRKKYWPLEIDPKLSIEQKEKYMVEWWEKSGDLLKGFSFDHKEIEEVAKRYSHALRDGSSHFFETLRDHHVPVLVFSAGLGDSVQAVLEQAGVMYENVKVVSNFLQYKNGQLDGFKTHVIHTFNKNEKALGPDYDDFIKNRKNAIVMGDSIGDCGMADGMQSTSNILKIGFLYHNAEDYLPQYMDAFDIVLIDDQTMDLPNAILSLILENQTN